MANHLIPSLIGLNPDVETYQRLKSWVSVEQSVTSEELSDMKNGYFIEVNNVCTKLDKLKNQIDSFFYSHDLDLKINHHILNNAYKILDALYPSIYEVLSEDNVYPTSHGTLVLDWEKNDNELFSLEIGVDSFGYFIDGNEISLVEHLNYDKIETLTTALSNFIGY